MSSYSASFSSIINHFCVLRSAMTTITLFFHAFIVYFTKPQSLKFMHVSFQKSVAEVLIFTTSFLLCMFQLRILLYALKLQYSKMGHKMCCYMGDTTKVNLALDLFYFLTPPHSTSQPSQCSYNSYMV